MHPAQLPPEPGCCIRLLHPGKATAYTGPATVVWNGMTIPVLGSAGLKEPKVFQAVLWVEGSLHERIVKYDMLSAPPPTLAECLYMFAANPERWTRLPTPKAA